MKKITEQTLLEMSRNLKSRLYEENIMQTQAQQDTGVGTGIHNFVRRGADWLGNTANAMVGSPVTPNAPLIDPNDQSLYIEQNGKQVPLTGENNGHIYISGDPNNKDLPFYGPIIDLTTGNEGAPDFFWKGEGTYKNHPQVPVGNAYKKANNLFGTAESNPNVAAAIKAATGGITAPPKSTTTSDETTKTNAAQKKIPVEGMKATAKDGSPIIFKNNKWVYL